MPHTTGTDDTWLRELLLGGDWHPDGDDADGMAAVLAARDPGVDSSGGATRALLSVGVSADLDAVELLFTSLLLQVGRALGAAERAADRRSASRSFRRAFLLGYATRIGERLTSARDRATTAAAAEQGLDLLPVLRIRQQAVDDAFTELFPRVRSSHSRSSMDAAGYWAGRAAADEADVGSRRSPLH